MLSLDQWLAYQTRVHPQTIDLGLDRLRQVLDRLPIGGNPRCRHHRRRHQWQGLGERLLRGDPVGRGYRVGTFTSPHLRDYRERIRIHDAEVTAEEAGVGFREKSRRRAASFRLLSSSSIPWRRF